MSDEQETFADMLFWALWYNGHDEHVSMLADMLEHIERLTFDDELFKMVDYGDDNMMQMLWMILVQQFGDYGSSPRYGWVDDTDGAAKFIREQIARTFASVDER